MKGCDKLKNKRLKMAMMNAEVTQGIVAKEMGMTQKTFCNKINSRTVNGYKAYFTDTEKAWLSAKFKIKTTEIE